MGAEVTGWAKPTDTHHWRRAKEGNFGKGMNLSSGQGLGNRRRTAWGLGGRVRWGRVGPDLKNSERKPFPES